MNVNEDMLNKNCFLLRNLNLKLYRRCDFCDLRLFQCFGMQSNLFSFLIILAVMLPLIWQNAIMLRLSALAVTSLIIILGRIIDRKTDELVQIQQELIARTKELEQEQEKLKNAQAKLIQQEKMASVGLLAAGIAHEINNPLGGILGYSQFALEKISRKSLKDLTEDDIRIYSQYLKDIENQSQRTKKIVQQLLKFARASAKEVFIPLNVNAILNETLSFTAHQLEMANIKLIQNLSSSPSEILGNATLLQQVFTNIILNSLQAMPKGGELSVSTEMIQEKSQEMIQITFSDSGCGILQENLSRVFDPFFTTKEAGEGTGLGLSVSYGIIKDHKGEIIVKSEKGKGTTFTITIPALEHPADSESTLEQGESVTKRE